MAMATGMVTVRAIDVFPPLTPASGDNDNGADVSHSTHNNIPADATSFIIVRAHISTTATTKPNTRHSHHTTTTTT
jgi:hypothetical protein